jgi:hypothetical protein
VDLLVHLTDDCPVVFDRRSGGPVSLTAKVIARWTDRSLQTISDYRTGKTNIPVEFWRRVLEHYFDARIIALLVPDCLHWEAFDHDHLVDTAPAFFRQAIAAEGAHHEQMKYVADILGDGRVDELDAGTIQKFSDAYVAHRTRDAQLHRSIIAAFHRSREKAGAP